MGQDVNISSQILIDALKDVAAYPEATSSVEFTQTQMSFVFLTDDYAYKVKKAVNLGYLDYTTLEKRLYFCNRELELNRRLAPSVYLAVLPVVRYGERISIGGEGEVIDYAVKMKRLPSEWLMDNLLRRNKVNENMIVQVARKLSAFHNEAATNSEIGSYGELKAIKHNTDENFSQTEKPALPKNSSGGFAISPMVSCSGMTCCLTPVSRGGE